MVLQIRGLEGALVDFGDYLEGLAAATKDGREVAYCFEQVAKLGFDKHMLAIRPKSADAITRSVLESTNYPAAWVDAYFNGLYANDPAAAQAIVDSMPGTWDSLSLTTDEQRAFMGHAADNGLKYGIYVPLLSPQGLEGAVSVAGDSNPDTDRNLMAVYSMTNALHVQRVEKWAVSTLEGFDLTAREVEVMRWVAAGKKDAEIGDILGISESGASYHVKSILAKVQMRSRLQIAQLAQQTGVAKADYPFFE